MGLAVGSPVDAALRVEEGEALPIALEAHVDDGRLEPSEADLEAPSVERAILRAGHMQVEAKDATRMGGAEEEELGLPVEDVLGFVSSVESRVVEEGISFRDHVGCRDPPADAELLQTLLETARPEGVGRREGQDEEGGEEGRDEAMAELHGGSFPLQEPIKGLSGGQGAFLLLILARW